MTFVESIRARAKERPRKIVFPESMDARVAAAVIELAHYGMVEPVLVGDSDALEDIVASQPGIEVVDPRKDAGVDALAEHLWHRRREKGMSREEAEELALQPLHFANLLVATGRAHGSVAGITHTTRDVLRSALWTVGPAEGIRTISSTFYLLLDGHQHRHRSSPVLSFADPAVVLDPTAAQLAEIGIAAAAARVRAIGDEPRVAFLSYSTYGSSDGPSVRKVQEAVEIFRQRAPDILVDGEVQADAALNAAVGRRKAPESEVAGRANILVFPNLDAANIGYKLVEELGGIEAFGPIVQGLKHPCNDLSRGSTPDDVVNVACVTALMS
jgi:phosphate acetyltransferase